MLTTLDVCQRIEPNFNNLSLDEQQKVKRIFRNRLMDLGYERTIVSQWEVKQGGIIPIGIANRLCEELMLDKNKYLKGY